METLFDDSTNTDRTEVYLKHGSPPTRHDFDFQASEIAADHTVSSFICRARHLVLTRLRHGRAQHEQLLIAAFTAPSL